MMAQSMDDIDKARERLRDVQQEYIDTVKAVLPVGCIVRCQRGNSGMFKAEVTMHDGYDGSRIRIRNLFSGNEYWIGTNFVIRREQ